MGQKQDSQQRSSRPAERRNADDDGIRQQPRQQHTGSSQREKRPERHKDRKGGETKVD